MQHQIKRSTLAEAQQCCSSELLLVTFSGTAYCDYDISAWLAAPEVGTANDSAVCAVQMIHCFSEAMSLPLKTLGQKISIQTSALPAKLHRLDLELLLCTLAKHRRSAVQQRC
jgi:hypothetical protein